MAPQRPCTALAGIALGASAAVVLFAVEVLTRGAPWSGWGFVLALALGVGLGGGLGAVAAGIRRWPVLVAAVLGPTFLLGLEDLHWAVHRAFELVIQRHAQAMFGAIHAALLVTVVLAIFGLSLVALERLPKRFKRRPFTGLAVATVVVVTANLGLWVLQLDSLDLGVWIVFAWVAAVGALVAFDCWVNILGPLCLLACVACLELLPWRYQQLAGTFSGWAWGFAFLLGRYNLGRRLDFDLGRMWLAGALAVVVNATIVAERVVVAHPFAWRIHPASGALSGSLFGLRRATDFDGDGYSVFFGTRDCAPFDSRRGPQKHEILGNGIDDNCLAGSAERRDPPFLRSIDRALPRPAVEARGRDLILYVVDALRYDDAVELSPPAIAAFLGDSVVYDRLYATGSFTSQTLMGHLAGRLPSTAEMVVVHRLNAYPSPVPKGLPHYLAEQGYDTGLAGGMACDEGSDCSESAYFLPVSYGDGFRVAELAPRGAVSEDVLELARRAWSRLDSERPRLLWVHDLSVHDADKSRDSYRERVRAAAQTFGRLREEIGKDAVWVLTADHGEEFLEHGDYRHARTLYEEVLHVPLAIHIPGRGPGRIANVCSARSLMPTLLALLGVHVGPPGLGPYLCLTAEGCTDQPAPAALELIDLHLHGLVLGRRKIVRDIGQGLLFSFDLERDPGEKDPNFYPPDDLEAALVDWEEQVFGDDGDASVWPYLPR